MTAEIVIAICTVIVTVLSVWKIFSYRFDKIERKIDSVENRIGSIESSLARVEGYLHGAFGYHAKTGSGKE